MQRTKRKFQLGRLVAPTTGTNDMRLLITAAISLALAGAAAAQNSTTFRNERGQTTGTATTNSNGTTTFRNERGQTTGTATKR
jgi:hypothetical protein